MLRRRFYQSYKSPINNGVYAVRQDGRLIPLSRADNSCISVAIIYDGHKIMIEKNEDSNQSYKRPRLICPILLTRLTLFIGVNMARIRLALQIMTRWTVSIVLVS